MNVWLIVVGCAALAAIAAVVLWLFALGRGDK